MNIKLYYQIIAILFFTLFMIACNSSENKQTNDQTTHQPSPQIPSEGSQSEGSQKASLKRKFGLGLKVDKEAYDALPQKATLTRDLYTVPKRYSLKNYLPAIKSQGQYGTCVGWSTAYYARTISWAKNRRLSHSQINDYAFSPLYVYRKASKDRECDEGTMIEYALDFMKSTGAIKYTDFSTDCGGQIKPAFKYQAAPYKIGGYVTLFYSRSGGKSKIRAVKKALSQGKPVVIAINVYNSFIYATGPVWRPKANETSDGAHALCVIGYDDTQHGGAFEIVNSWGADWGNQGSIWIKYSDFAAHVFEAFELIDNIKPIDKKTSYLAGKLSFLLSSGERVAMKQSEGQELEDWQNMAGLTSYTSQQAYTSGTRFRLLLGNKQPAYVYALATDHTMKITKLFPHNAQVSPALNYSYNEVALPSENEYIAMDNTPGTDVFCLLYSKESLDIQEIRRQIENASGSFAERLKQVLGSRLIDNKSIDFDADKVSFKAQARQNQVVLPVIVMLKHI